MNYAELFQKYSGKLVQVVLNDGEVLNGEFFAYISNADNDPEPESIVVGRIEVNTHEIRSFRVM